ncbi:MULTISPECIES: helix-turn-helix domain-containing protein [Flammeovirga]|uniref:MarR family transcriptional regulator n=1 Tax=Flammeovirga agarivorans TaxID=2726742 RepID=A0A7X8SH27_9BACT|nr:MULTISPECIES: hypothetical protein [Flammeovirga]NLR90070.1 hypothetical protein [Flammeovirga agarivorans]
MSSETKYSKFLIGMCLNTGQSLQAIAKNLGIYTNRDEINALATKLEAEGLVSRIERTAKETYVSLSKKGQTYASTLMDSAI